MTLDSDFYLCKTVIPKAKGLLLFKVVFTTLPSRHRLRSLLWSFWFGFDHDSVNSPLIIVYSSQFDNKQLHMLESDVYSLPLCASIGNIRPQDKMLIAICISSWPHSELDSKPLMRVAFTMTTELVFPGDRSYHVRFQPKGHMLFKRAAFTLVAVSLRIYLQVRIHNRILGSPVLKEEKVSFP